MRNWNAFSLAEWDALSVAQWDELLVEAAPGNPHWYYRYTMMGV